MYSSADIQIVPTMSLLRGIVTPPEAVGSCHKLPQFQTLSIVYNILVLRLGETRHLASRCEHAQ